VIATRDFVFVHIPKTGGTFVRRVFRDHAPAEWAMEEIEDHVPARQTPEPHADKPKFGFARNPFTWYVSWYHYFSARPNDFFLGVSADGQRPFAETMRALIDAPQVRGGIHGGPFTLYLQHFFGQELELAEVFKMETLREDLAAWLARFGPVPPAMQRAIAEHEVVNRSAHGGWREYYDDELFETVVRLDRGVFQWFGYDLP